METVATPRVSAPRLVPVTTAPPTPMAPPRTPSGAATSPIAALLDAANQMTPDFAKHKCKNFLATLQKLAEEQPQAVEENVKNLIQGLIDGVLDPETFTTELQRELDSVPQPCLVPFLKRSLSSLQHSLISGELSIDGIRTPPSTALTKHKINDRVFVRLDENGIIWPGCIQKIDEFRIDQEFYRHYHVQLYGTTFPNSIATQNRSVVHEKIFKFDEMNTNIFIRQNEKGSAEAMIEIEHYPDILYSTDEPSKKKRKRNSKARDLKREIKNSKARGLKREINNLLKIVTEKDEIIQTLEDDFEKTVDQNHTQIQNLEESRFTRVTDLEQEKNNLLTIVAEKDQKIKTLEDELDKTVDQNHTQIQHLEESVSKNTDLEQEKTNLLKMVAEKDEKIKTLEDDFENTVNQKDMQIQNLEESVTVLVDRIDNLKDDLEKTTDQINIKDKALKESDDKLKKVADIMAAKDEKIQTLEADFEKMIDQNHMQVQNLEQQKNNLLGTVSEKDEKIKTLKADFEKTINQNHIQIQTLKESITDLEQEKTNLLGTVAEKDEKVQTLKANLEKTIDQNQEQTQNLDESVCKIKELEQEKTNLLETVTEKEERIQNLKDDLEKTTNELDQMKNEETIETLSEVKTKLFLQMQQKELYEKQHIEMMELLNIPVENRGLATILPAIQDLKNLLSLMQEQAETNHYTNAQALIEAISNNNE